MGWTAGETYSAAQWGSRFLVAQSLGTQGSNAVSSRICCLSHLLAYGTLGRFHLESYGTLWHARSLPWPKRNHPHTTVNASEA